MERDDTIQDKVSLLAHLLLIKCTQENVDITKYILMKWANILSFLESSGKENLWLEKEEPGIGKVQVCAGL